ncbi:quinone oxidoreductase family protein [Nocardioides stalactiti]|uniref:quinone oxidoreductase family protein n=1 Tax=Nocardioides stalactiti TaxID=2755356 RepID=UPI001600E4BF|nr:zinc-binding dehydrogenase [Nocardioides stalactiti]
MRALQVTRHGDPIDVLAVTDIEPPRPGPGEVLVRVATGALNNGDVQRCLGGLVTMGKEPPYTLGMDVCGTVEAAGDGAERWVGQRVVAVCKDAFGGLAELAVAPAAGVFAAPPELDDVAAGGFLLPFHTAYLALALRAGLRSGETLLVTSGASGIGSALIQVGSALGARVLATASTPEKADLCRSLGAETVLDPDPASLPEAVLGATVDAGADVVADLVGGELTGRLWTCTAREGRYLPLGFTGDPEAGMSGHPLRMVGIGNFSVVGVLSAWVEHVDPMLRRFGLHPFERATGDEVHTALLAWVADGTVRPHVGRVVDLADAPAALDDHQHRRSVGRTVVRVADTA